MEKGGGLRFLCFIRYNDHKPEQRRGQIMLTIDRFEGELAVCEQEDGRMFTVEKVAPAPGLR